MGRTRSHIRRTIQNARQIESHGTKHQPTRTPNVPAWTEVPTYCNSLANPETNNNATICPSMYKASSRLRIVLRIVLQIVRGPRIDGGHGTVYVNDTSVLKVAAGQQGLRGTKRGGTHSLRSSGSTFPTPSQNTLKSAAPPSLLSNSNPYVLLSGNLQVLSKPPGPLR